MLRITFRLVFGFVVCATFCCHGYGQFIEGEFFRDDFEDGDHRDSSPANWMRGGFQANDDVVEDGTLIIRGLFGDASVAPVEPNGLPYWSYEDATVTTQLRILDGGEEAFAGVYGRSRDARVYFGGIWGDGRLALGETFFDGTTTVDRVQTTLDAVNNDVLLKMDFDGTLMSLTAWAEGTDMPTEPQLTYEDSTLQSGTFAMVGSGSGDVGFRWFEIEEVPEPSSQILAGLALCVALRFRGSKSKANAYTDT